MTHLNRHRHAPQCCRYAFNAVSAAQWRRLSCMCALGHLLSHSSQYEFLILSHTPSWFLKSILGVSQGTVIWSFFFFFLIIRRPPISPLFPNTPLSRPRPAGFLELRSDFGHARGDDRNDRKGQEEPNRTKAAETSRDQRRQAKNARAHHGVDHER